MKRLRPSKSLRKFLRAQKARIRRESHDAAEAEQKVRELLADVYGRYTKLQRVESKNQ